MCADMCTDMCIDVYIELWVEMCVDVWIDMCINIPLPHTIAACDRAGECVSRQRGRGTVTDSTALE